MAAIKSNIRRIACALAIAPANRPSGWNTWLTFSISEAAPKAVTPTRHLTTK